jgi:hypothetical protein
MIDKRGFLLSAASMAVAPSALATAHPPATRAATHAADWTAQLNRPFALSDGSSHWTVTLQAVNPVQPLAAAGHCPACEQFSLEFAHHGSGRVPAGLHRLQAADGSSQWVHLVDSGKAGPQKLRADFNLLLA